MVQVVNNPTSQPATPWQRMLDEHTDNFCFNVAHLLRALLHIVPLDTPNSVEENPLADLLEAPDER